VVGVRLTAPAAERNKEPIAEVLAEVLPPAGRVLEVASGSGQHVVHFAARFPRLRFVPSDPDPRARASIEAWIAEADLDNVDPPLALDASAQKWPVDEADAIVSINMVHISPWEATMGLFAGASRILSPLGVLYLYGPYAVDGAHTASSNERFDESLRARDPMWGVRDVRDVERLGAEHGFVLEKTVSMPANNLSVVFRRAGYP
jgi:cyclopropane fatty-acyl-phospholipid synthase-like methyltransferase